MEQTQAASSAAQESPVVTPEIDIARGPLVNLTAEQRQHWSKTGELPKPPEPTKADTASADPQASTDDADQVQSDNAPDTDTGKQSQDNAAKGKPQPKAKHLTAEERIAQLEATIAKIRQGAGIQRKTEPAPVAEAPKPQPQPQQQYTRPKPAADDKNQDGTSKYNSYEDFVEELADWKAEQRWVQAQREQAQQAQVRDFQGKMAAAKARHENFDEVVLPAGNAIVSDQSIPMVIKEMVGQSDVFPDLLYALASDQQEFETFMGMARNEPAKALRYVVLKESLIHEELEGKNKPAETPKPPVKTETRAPKPPAEIGGRGSTPPDALDSAVQAQDFRAFKAEANRRHIARISGK